MDIAEQTLLDELSYYFVIKEKQPDGSTQLSLGSYAPSRKNCETLPFDTETGAALYLLAKFREGAIVSEEHVETAHAILRGDQPMFVYEEKQPDSTLLPSLHNELPARESGIIAFASRSPRRLARFLLRWLYESKRVRASAETIQQAQALLG
jgi:hypothetical protein